MRILFVVNRLAHVRHFDRAVRLLADRGHDVCLASQDDDVELWGVLAKQPRKPHELLMRVTATGLRT